MIDAGALAAMHPFSPRATLDAIVELHHGFTSRCAQASVVHIAQIARRAYDLRPELYLDHRASREVVERLGRP